MITAQDIKNFIAKLDKIEISGDRSQKHLEQAILLLEHVASNVLDGRAFILEKE